MALSIRSLLLGTALAVTAGASAASANPITLYYSTNGGSSYTAFGSGDGFASGNVNTVSGYSLISANATGTPIIAAPNFQSQSIDVRSTGSGTLIVAAVQTGLTAPVTGFNLGWTNNSGSSVSVVESFGTISNTGTVTSLASQTLTPNMATATTVNYASPASYNLFESYTITFNGAGNINATISESGIATSVPEPVSLTLLGAGLAGLGMIRMRRKSV